MQPWPDDGPDPGRRADWPAPAGPEPGSRRRGPRIAALTLVALVALGAGAGAVYMYQHGLAGAMPASHGSGAAPGGGSSAGAGPGSTAGPPPGGHGVVHAMMLIGPVRAVGRDTVTVGGGPGPEVSALVTSATQFTGSARSLAQVRVGDTVAASILESNGVARVISLQDPATAS